MKLQSISFDVVIHRVWLRIAEAAYVGQCEAAIFRILLGAYFLFNLKAFSWISAAPAAWFDPPFLSFANAYGSFPPNWFFYGVDMLLPLACFCVAAGVKARVAGLTIALLYISASNFSYSFGKIDHGGVLIHTTLICLSFSNWGCRYALLPDRPLSDARHNGSFGILAIVVAFAMFTAGFEKAYVWIDFDPSTSGFLAWFNGGYYTLERQHFLAPIVEILPPLVYELFDYSAVLFELSGLLFLVAGRRFWHGWLIAACCFHLGNLLLLNILFTPHAVVYGAFLIAPIAGSLRNGLPLPPAFLKVAMMAAVALTLYQLMVRFLYIRALESGSIAVNEDANMFAMYVSLVIWLCLIGFSVFGFVKGERRGASPAKEELSPAV
ncbi:hypothetical protein [Pelagicoccus sp. SDUM812002]|uniref:hypothetical protein n=1 Tax=Pelagicoccus sp. SDUM812002 TaxID=3041266 RepID=UPI00280C3FE7|nr:hypothetical protein [Pelagicoccus sp. SDUM812002]MDQ8185161.1 hypothetical protein [Pelagicoccus sp. SDUM812002]